MPKPPVNTSKASAEDILFDCPHCAKSLAIDPRGAGLTVPCPQCAQPVQVPVPTDAKAETTTVEIPDDDREMKIAELADALEKSHAKIERLVESLEEVRERRKFLEKARVDNMDRFDRVSRELAVIQSAIDRIVVTLQEVNLNQGPPEPDQKKKVV